MRLGQLARKLNIKRSDIQQIVKEEFNIELGEHPNVKVQDEHVEFIENKFLNLDESNIEIEDSSPSKSSTEQSTKLVENVTPKTTEEVIVPTDLNQVEHIETKKAEDLTGPKIIGKVELPEPKPDMVEIDGVMVDRNELKAQEKEKRQKLQEAKKKAREEAKLKKEAKREALATGETIMSDKEKKAQEKRILDQIKRKEEFEKQKKKERYDQIKATHQSSAKLSKKQKKNIKEKEEEQKVEAIKVEKQIQSTEAPKGSILKRFWKWLTTE